ncbi:MAG: FIST C-terminal domain-containing protein [Phycisphaeraceae bacterium]|nr:FIST C-terminal domain-containing protein [Phycisphaeraceae bacterium]
MAPVSAVRCCRQAIDEPDPCRAVRGIVESAGTDAPALTVLFVDARYDLDGLAAALVEQIHGPVLACTSAGHQIAERGLFDHGMVAATLVTDQLSATLVAIPNVAQFGVTETQAVARQLGLDAPSRSWTRFGVALIDGMSFAEERVMALLYGASHGMNFVGGSAGDGQRFQKTYVFDGNRFVSGAAVVARVDTTLPCRTFGFQNFAPLDGRFVVTGAVAEKRQILELNGQPAASVYAAAIGYPNLDAQVVSRHPLLLRWDDRFYARAIRGWDEQRLDLFCAIEEGMVVRIGEASDLSNTTVEQYTGLRTSLGTDPRIIVAFHCYQRRVELERSANLEHHIRLMSRYPLIGFCTYGEQYNGLHMNQTVTGFALG